MTLVATPRAEVPDEIDPSLPELNMADKAEALLGRATQALDELADFVFWSTANGEASGRLDAETSETLAVGTERLRRTAEAATISVTSHIEQTQPFRGAGFFKTTAYLKHRLQLSGAEAYRRVQMARQSAVLDRWATGHAAGAIGTAQFRLMARIAANPRIEPQRLADGSLALWCDALECSFDEFERRALTWEALADPVGALNKAERATARRSVTLVALDSGGWGLHGRLDDIGGAEFNEIFAHFTDVEWRNDWAEAHERLGDDATVKDLRRTQNQRRCDALIAMARSAAANGSGVAAEPTVNFLIDNETARSTILGEPIDPARYREVTSRTASGRWVHPRQVVNCAMWAHVRRVVTDSASVVIDLGRRSRLFVGHAREAVMLLETECAWVGCDRPTTWCDADHSQGWKGQGPTAPNNGGPLCRTHNVLKEQGFQVVRSSDGIWHTFSPDGDEIF